MSTGPDQDDLIVEYADDIMAELRHQEFTLVWQGEDTEDGWPERRRAARAAARKTAPSAWQLELAYRQIDQRHEKAVKTGHHVYVRKYPDGEAGEWARMRERWERDPYEWLFACVPVSSPLCDCGGNGGRGDDHKLTCYIMRTDLDDEQAWDAWYVSADLWEDVAQEIAWRFDSEARYLTPDERGELDTQEAWDALTREEQMAELIENGLLPPGPNQPRLTK